MTKELSQASSFSIEMDLQGHGVHMKVDQSPVYCTKQIVTSLLQYKSATERSGAFGRTQTRDFESGA